MCRSRSKITRVFLVWGSRRRVVTEARAIDENLLLRDFFLPSVCQVLVLVFRVNIEFYINVFIVSCNDDCGLITNE